ncbi:MAG: hypothetical protein GX282_07070 [Campylobacteraceae bacterium]|nr:hypothetical protein [Campylobacteraceae bacterium]
MKKYLITLFASFIILFSGCAGKSSLNSGIIKESEPVFIDSKAKNNKVYIKFSNSSEAQSNLAEVLALNLSDSGYEIVASEKVASTAIKGNINYFKKVAVRRGSYPNVGVGVGRGWSGVGVGVGVNDIFGKSYIYTAQLSLLITVNDKTGIKNYKTLLDYQSDTSSLSSALGEFDSKVSSQILRYLSGY